MASLNKKNKAKNSFLYNLGALKNSLKDIKLKRILFYTNRDRKNNKIKLNYLLLHTHLEVLSYFF